MDNELLLISGEDIPFIEAQISIHQPTIREISLMGEEDFLIGCQFLKFTKEKILSEEDKRGLENKSDFEIFMSIMCSKDYSKYKNNVLMVLALLFPEYQIRFTNKEILLVNEQNSTRINKENYDVFKEILDSMFCLTESEAVNGEYNPIDKRAAKIAEKLKKHREKIANIKGKSKKIAIFSRYVSILSIGMQMDINIFNNYTVFQLKDSMKRYQMKDSYDMYIQAKMAGAEGLDEVEHWMDDIHSK